MTRIIAGSAGGRRIKTPPGTGTRPTTDRVREALFSSLQSTFGTFDDLSVLDLFAGSGAIGLEALSRGAHTVVLNEKDRRAAALIKGNARTLGLDGANVHVSAASSYLAGPPMAFDIVYLDPPYAMEAAELEALLTQLGSGRWLQEEAVIVVERSKRGRFRWPETLEAVRDKKYGETILMYGRLHG